MDSLKGRISDLLKDNFEHREFIPYGDLDALLTEEEVWNAVTNSSIEPSRREYIAKKIRHGGKRLFATLLTLDHLEFLYDFLENDNFSGASLDHKLPLDKASLEGVLKNRAATPGSAEKSAGAEHTTTGLMDIGRFVTRFLKEQYKFLAPTFERKSTHRMISEHIILPFFTKTPIGEGGFGNVSEITLPPTQMEGFDVPESTTFALKELKKQNSGRSTFEDEISCLEILRLIDHPNILELYCCFTYRHTHHLLFPMAKGGDLEGFLHLDERPTGLASTADVLLALCGLASALENLHSFSNTGLDLNMIGCHHDIKPQNILVVENRFVLSDFGLSQMKKSTEQSKTISRGEGFYLAPEFEDQLTFDRFPVGRSSDIWAFGCILLTTLIYLRQGKTGVESLKTRLRVEVHDASGSSSIFYAFHAGKRPNQQIMDCIDEMKHSATPAEQCILRLIESMLRIAPEKRPAIDQCCERLRFAALRDLASATENALQKEAAKEVARKGQKASEGDSLTFDVQYQTFQIWLRVMDQDPEASATVVQAESTFHRMKDTLVNLQTEVEKLGHADTSGLPRFFRLKILLRQLCSLLDKKFQKRINSLVELAILGSEAEAGNLSALDDHVGTEERILTLASIRQVEKMSSESASKTLLLNQSDLEIQPGEKKTFYVAKFRRGDDQQGETQNVIVETINYDASWQDQDGKQLFDRMQNILRLHQPTSEFRALRCLGYVHIPVERVLALVYAFPPKSENVCAVQLVEVMGATATSIIPRTHSAVVSLQDRFRLASQLADAVFEFHKINWLHKGISPYNIIFFSKSPKDARTLKSPFLIGFSHSRPDQAGQISAMTSESEELLNSYQDPEYRTSLNDRGAKHVRYRAEFDYYSLGLVLLEIGYWKPLHELRKGEPAGLEQDEFLLHLAVYLAGPMGKNYAMAVQACLGKKSGRYELAGDKREDVDTNFERRVMQKLRACSVE